MDRRTLIYNIVSKIKNGVFVEIGTDGGDFADFILESSPDSTLYCIDPYISYNDYNDAINNKTGDHLYQSVKDRLKNKYGDRVIFIRQFSKSAVHLIPDNVDLVYIDGNHKYNYVYKDLELYFPKVRMLGYIIGDDAVDIDDTTRNEDGDVYIEWCPGCYGHYGVIKAFNEFLDKKNTKGQIIGNQYVVNKYVN